MRSVLPHEMTVQIIFLVVGEITHWTLEFLGELLWVGCLVIHDYR